MTHEAILDNLERIAEALELDDKGLALAILDRVGRRVRGRIEHDRLVAEGLIWTRDEGWHAPPFVPTATPEPPKPRHQPKPKKPKGRKSNRPHYSQRRKGTGYVDTLVQDAGFRDYDAYIRSDHWMTVKRLFRLTWPEARCVVCRDVNYQIHHLSYDRVGRERFSDLLPVCQKCHSQLHEAHKGSGVPLHDIRRGLFLAFAFSPDQIDDRLRRWNELQLTPKANWPWPDRRKDEAA